MNARARGMAVNILDACLANHPQLVDERDARS